MGQRIVTMETPVTAVDLRFIFRGGRPALYLVETYGEWTRRRFDRVTDGLRWNQWLERVGLPALDPPVTARELRQMSDLRRAVYGVAHAKAHGLPVVAADLNAINAYARKPPLIPVISLEDEMPSYERPTQEQILSWLARDAIDLLTGPYRNSIKTCESDTCPVLFVDMSTKQNRRWCSHNCGARIATAKYRKRQSSDRSPGTGPGPVSSGGQRMGLPPVTGVRAPEM